MKDKIARNDPCPCGSGKKFKKCCLQRPKSGLIHHFRGMRGIVVGAIMCTILSVGGLLVASKKASEQPDISPDRQSGHPSVSTLPKQEMNASDESFPPLPSNILLTPEDIPKYDILTLNLLCAKGLPGVGELDVQKYRKTLKAWAAHVKFETERHLYQFHQNPSDFSNSEAYFRMLTLITVLQQDFNIQYNPRLMDIPNGQGQLVSDFFRHAEDVFLYGLIDNRLGTCASMPVLTVAVGRELGYPLKLVSAKGHLLVRWEDEHETFNIEAAGRGLSTFPDTYYETWPSPLSEEEKQSGFFLTSFSPIEEFVTFLEIRGSCLLDNDRPVEALVVYEHIRTLVPSHPYIHRFISAALHEANRQRQHAAMQRRKN